MTALIKALEAKRARLNEDEKGFTLIELLVVVIIIGILAAIAIPIFLGQQEQAKASAVESAVTNAKTAVVAAMVEAGSYPAAADITAIEDQFTDGPIAVDITGSGSAFCVAGDHDDLTGRSWAADDSSGVIEGTCSATFVATATP